jgi:hypothetical protein
LRWSDDYGVRIIRTLFALSLTAVLLPAALRAGALSDLKERRDLTPENFLRSFADFRFELGEQVQDPESFLQRKRGDCDDFASLAATVLKERGYSTKIVVIMMNGATHVVCYVKESHGYLDFNHRADVRPIIDSDGTLEDIAQKTASYFRLGWYMASEVRYEKKSPVFLASVFSMTAPEKTAEASLPRRNAGSARPSVAVSAPAWAARKTAP